MSDFPLAGQPVVHPSWCDPAYCTAPATYPAAAERGRSGEHRSAPLGEDGAVFEGDQVYLSQAASVPWKCETYLNIRTSDVLGRDRRMSISMDYTSPLMWAVLAQADDLYREYPTLMQAEGVKRGGPWRPLSVADALPEPRETAPIVDVPTVDDRKPAKIVDDEGQEELAAIQARVQARIVTDFTTGQAEAVIVGWTPGAAAVVEGARVALPNPQRLWVHSGPCIYCPHGPACVTCDLTQGPYWGKGPAGREYPGPACGNCSAECKRLEIAADPYYSGDYVTMFGDDE
jgi:hypothetical protein